MNTANQQNSIAAILTEVAAEGDLIPIFPAGIVIGYDGRGPYNLKNADAVIAASKRSHVDLVIDRDHVADACSFGRPNPAAGWIKELINQEGAIMARVEWTPAAQKQLADKEYRYISPTFSFNTETREVIFRYKNAAADPLTRADINNDCYIVDDESVGRTSGGSTRSVAGKVVDLDATGVWVRFQ